MICPSYGDATLVTLISANIAVGRASLQSSTDEGGNSARAVDGNMATDWSEASCTHTKPEAKPWLRIDFGQARKVGKVTLYIRYHHYILSLFCVGRVLVPR